MNAEGKIVIPVAYALDYYQEESYSFRNGLIMVVYSFEEEAALGKKDPALRSRGNHRIKGYIVKNGVKYYEE